MDIQLPRWRCHKIVQAAKIIGFRENGNADMPTILLDGDLSVDLLPDWHVKHTPHVGDYLVVYDDNYVSVSPTAAFENGYTLLGETLVAQQNEQMAPGPITMLGGDLLGAESTEN